MAGLPPDGRWLVQQNNGQVSVFDSYTQDVLITFDPTDMNAVARAQKTIYDSDLTDEQKTFAHFWSGYFYAHAS